MGIDGNPKNRILVFLYKNQEKKSSCDLLKKSMGIFSEKTGIPLDTAQIIRDGRGKPGFEEDCGVFFSISHTKNIWACAFAQQPVGLDIERVRPCREEMIAGRFFHREEAAFVARHKERFFEVWTAKESYVKYTGEGITDAFGAFSVISGDEISRFVNDVQLCHFNGIEGCNACLCAGDIGTIEIIEMAK